jgi:endonuclease/exonuclease/phosphatase family metal-dependent hydrolase
MFASLDFSTRSAGLAALTPGVKVLRTIVTLGRASVLAAAALVIAGCAHYPPDRLTECAIDQSRIDVDQQSGEASTELSVLTYNVEGLPWPARSNRSPRLREIGRQLAAMRKAGRAPDIVLLQEVFTTDAGRIATSSGYVNRVRGPGRKAKRPSASDAADPSLVNGRKLFKGEGLGRLFSGGLYVLSDFPVTQTTGQPFRRRECAGFDCLANKGLQHITVQVPGVPQPLEVFNTHLNAGRAARVRQERALIAHQLQIEETARFIEQQRPAGSPMILGGDFNMRGDDERFAYFSQLLPYSLVHQYCAFISSPCQVGLSWDGDEPWMDTQDLQSFDDGDVVTVRPVRVEGLFDQPWKGAPLADHDGLLVVYRLSWPATATTRSSADPRCLAPLAG